MMISNLMAHNPPRHGNLVTSLTPPTSDAVPGPSPLVNWMIHWSENLVWWSRSRRSAPAQAAPEPGRGWGPGHQGSDSGHVNTVHSGHTPHTRSLSTKSQHPAIPVCSGQGVYLVLSRPAAPYCSELCTLTFISGEMLRLG